MHLREFKVDTMTARRASSSSQAVVQTLFRNLLFLSFTSPYLPEGSITFVLLLPAYYLWAITLPAFDPLTARSARDNGDTVPLGGWTGWPRAACKFILA